MPADGRTALLVLAVALAVAACDRVTGPGDVLDPAERSTARLSGGSSGTLALDTAFLLGGPPATRRSRAIGVNDSGRVVGEVRAADGPHAFAWDTTGGFEDLTPNANSAMAHDIGNDGTVVGDIQRQQGFRTRGFKLTGRTLQILDPFFLQGASFAFGVNDAGDAVGIGSISLLEGHAALWA